MKPEERIGEVYGIYTIVGVDREAKGDPKIYKCKCNVCGWTSYFSLYKIQQTTSCTHTNRNGGYREYKPFWVNKRLKQIFNGMMQRCYNSNDMHYGLYGQKGVKICDDWINNPSLFEAWSIKNGYDDSLTIDRIDSNGDYCPENCRWISCEDNSKYKSTTNIIVVDEESHTGRDWAKVLGFGMNTINTYIRLYGMDDTIEFIRRYRKNPEFAQKRKVGESFFSLYMN